MRDALTVLMGSSLLAISYSASAQTEGAQAEDSRSDIVVTAKSREERLQDVPLSITALTTADLGEAQIRDIRDLQKITPNISLFGGSGRNDPSAYAMRGLTSNTSDERYQGISFFLDGIALSGQLASLDIDNVERVEIIKGPQAATFGRSTYSGAVNFITKDPSGNDINGYVRARGSFSHSAPEASYFLGGSLTLPLVQDKLWLSVSGSVTQNGAVAKSADEDRPVGRERSQFGTATLFYEPDDTFSIKLRGLYTHDSDTVPAQTLQHPRDWLEAGIDVTPMARGLGSFLPDHMPDPDVNQVATKGTYGTKRDRYFASAIISKKMGDYELSYRGGYLRYEHNNWLPGINRATGVGQDPVFGDQVGTGSVTVTGLGTSTSKGKEVFENTSHQLVILSPGDLPIRWRVGAYYFWEKDTSWFPLNATTANPTGKLRQDTIENIAGFGGLDWDVTDKLTLSSEGRIARETLNYLACATCISPIAQGRSQGSTDFTPRFTLSYKASQDNLLYGLYSRGVKSGRFSYVVLSGVPTIFYADPEKLDNFEIGSKNSFMGGRLVFNAAGFYNKVKDQQLVSTVTTATSTGGVLNITSANNVGESEIWGFELESTFKLTPRLTIRGAVGYAHQEFTTTEPIRLAATSSVGFPVSTDGSVVLDGKTQGNVPRWNGYISGEYTVPDMFQDYAMSFRTDGSYRGSYYATLANTVSVRSAWTVNTRLSFYNDQMDFALFGRNIFNNQRATGSGLAGATGGCAFIETNTAVYGSNQQCLYSSPPRPAEWGAEAAFRF
ncbi:TonB-dependent receptor [Sphingobium boeckii]|uniref:Outer membrane receptor protein involved in Fe transport n=1 Tax=Sphingobium boeckii TaxID=1082345 RepID=A0A7W9AIR5_9SPHN|nr:TonB-dependent receptor [Sphingobium boeckii]MBB5686400.1 outer membrane receptor protein involved in Fe transport [Sphingobium boeckii]